MSVVADRLDGAGSGSIRGDQPSHFVQFYEDDAFLVDAIGRFIGGGLEAGDAAVVLATERHRSGLADRLRARGLDPAALREAPGYVELDAAETLTRLLVRGRVDERRFVEIIGGALARASQARRRPCVRVFGELVALLWADGRHDAALRVEELWNDLARVHAISLLCAYPMRGFDRDAHRGAFLRICAEHDEVVPDESFTALGSTRERDRRVAELQQKARSLEAEVAERNRLEQALQDRVRELGDADRRKDEFLATLAHELRNPLAPIRMAVSLVRSHPPGDAARYLDVIDRQAENLSRLVDDLLDVARITRGRIELRNEEVDVATIVARAVDATRHVVDLRRHAASVTLPAHPVHVLGDPVRLEQVLVNLLLNAAKYTPCGGQIWLTVEPAADHVEVRVRDTGVGIAPELLERVFDLFQQAERSLDRADGGLGIGLTVARRLVEMHGGTIEARSDGPGRGAEFTLRLPRVAAEREASPGHERAPHAADAGALQILVVDDNADAGEVLAEILRDRGHEVRTASDGPAALREALDAEPHLVLLDLGLPGMDGFEVARRLRAARSPAVLVALSGYGQERDRRLTAEAGFSGHLVKPVQLEDVLRIVEQTRSALRGEPAAQPQASV
jgi:signal transduction histidine kinase/ActR/RegA family two-component response regulator